METNFVLNMRRSFFKLFILPMRNGNMRLLILLFSGKHLFILPMRNGNAAQAGVGIDEVLTFYPTYEEWKQDIAKQWGINFDLFILPMRNGNNSKLKNKEQANHFLSYL